MGYISIEPANAGYRPPPIVPNKVAKTMGFNFLPEGTRRLTDGKTWGLYYCAWANISYLVYDLRDHWRIVPVPGKLRVSYIKSYMAQKPCCQED